MELSLAFPMIPCFPAGLQGGLEEAEGGVQHGWSGGSGRHPGGQGRQKPRDRHRHLRAGHRGRAGHLYPWAAELGMGQGTRESQQGENGDCIPREDIAVSGRVKL